MASPAHGLAIIGGGAAGLMAAQFAASFGVRVVLVDRQRLGGDCLWTGCVPSKTLLRAAHVADAMRHAARYGLTATEPVIDFQAVMARVRAAQTDIYSDETPESWREKGIDVALGEASFINPQTLRVGDWEISARHYLVASGAVPLVPNIPGLKDTPYLTYETIWDMAELPAHLIVVGGGPIGCEMAQAFRRLGSEVTVIEALDRLADAFRLLA